MKETLLVVGIRGLGRVVALHFAKQGWRVACAARTKDATEALARDVTAAGGEGVAIGCDVAKSQTLGDVAKLAPDLVFAALSPGGRFGSKAILEIDDEELERGPAVMVRGTWNLLKATGPAMTTRGS